MSAATPRPASGWRCRRRRARAAGAGWSGGAATGAGSAPGRPSGGSGSGAGAARRAGAATPWCPTSCWRGGWTGSRRSGAGWRWRSGAWGCGRWRGGWRSRTRRRAPGGGASGRAHRRWRRPWSPWPSGWTGHRCRSGPTGRRRPWRRWRSPGRGRGRAGVSGSRGCGGSGAASAAGGRWGPPRARPWRGRAERLGWRHPPEGVGMRPDPAEAIALFRYRLVAEATDPRLSPAERGRLVRALAGQAYALPEGGRRQYSRGTLDRWVRAYREQGLDGLRPQPRADRGSVRRHPELLEEAGRLRAELPTRSAAQIGAILLARHGVRVAERTIRQYLRRRGLHRAALAAQPRAFGRFEAERPNELWIADVLVGPFVPHPRVAGSRRAYLFVLVDDGYGQQRCDFGR